MRGIQTLRKDCNLLVTDRIRLYAYYSEKSKDCTLLEKAFNAHKDYIASETLSADILWKEVPNSVLGNAEIEASDQIWSIGIEKQN